MNGREGKGKVVVTDTGKISAGAFFVLFVCMFVLGTGGASAQDDPAPPPSTTISKDDRTRLESKSGIKDRSKLALELMGAHLAAAENFRLSENFEAAYRELGSFHGLLDNAVNYLVNADLRGNKVLDEFKRMDIGLRGFLPRIEAIRRDLPFTYDEYVRSLLKHVREARAKAAEPFFDDNIVRDGNQ